jgi:glutathione S-transferase
LIVHSWARVDFRHGSSCGAEESKMLKLYHAEPVANSLKALIPLKEKGLPFESVYVDLHKFEQHEPWFVKINPEGQVPVLDHDGAVITHTSVINEYLEDAFPETPPLRPSDPIGKARMRYWNKFCDEHVMNYVSIHGWHRMVGVIARSVEGGEFDRLMSRIPLYEQREKWRTARSGFSEADLTNATRKIEVAVDKVEKQLLETPWIAGETYTLADINFFSYCGISIQRMFPEMQIERRAPRVVDWLERMRARPGVQAALAMPNRTNPALRTFTGEAR